MFLTRIRFGRPRSTLEKDPIDAVHAYLASLLKNGQIGDDYLVRELQPPIEAYVKIPRPDALKTRHLSPWGRRTFNVITEVFGTQPIVESIEAATSRRFPSWRSAKSLYLYTHWFDDGPPLHSPEFAAPIPLYLLPITAERREYIHGWAQSYRDHDRIWIGSGRLEIPAYKELVDPASDLSQKGREHCAEIEAAIGKPTFYYLMRYYGRREGETERPCPGCGRPWSVRRRKAAHRFAEFEFTCRPCRLVSHSSVTEEDERHARIGEYRPRNP